MSVVAINWAFKQQVGKPSAKLVLVKLADHANDDGKCWPSFRRICLDTELSRDSVIRQIKFLEQKALLTVFRRYRARSYASNLYQLNFERVGHSESAQAASSTVRLAPRAVLPKDQATSTGSPRVVAQSHPNRHIEPSIQPSIEPSLSLYKRNGNNKKWNRDTIEYAEAKLLLSKLNEDVFGQVLSETRWWPDMEGSLKHALPMKREKFELVDRFYRLPDDHPIFRVIQAKPSIESVIRNLRWEPRRIRFALMKIGF